MSKNINICEKWSSSKLNDLIIKHLAVEGLSSELLSQFTAQSEGK